MSDPTSIDSQVAAVRRECGLRRRLYPRWVSQSKMTQAEADRQLAAMEAALATLERVRAERVAAVTPPDLFPTDESNPT